VGEVVVAYLKVLSVGTTEQLGCFGWLL